MKDPSVVRWNNWSQAASAPFYYLDRNPNIGNGYLYRAEDVHCYLFFSDDNGHLYRAQTTVANFEADPFARSNSTC